MRPTTNRWTLPAVVRGTLLSLLVAGGISSGSALARTIIVEIAPPPPRFETVPTLHRGYAWAPGYWSWHGNKHVWVNGHTMRARNGYEWSPDRWNEANGRHEFQEGRWTRTSERGPERHGQ